MFKWLAKKLALQMATITPKDGDIVIVRGDHVQQAADVAAQLAQFHFPQDITVPIVVLGKEVDVGFLRDQPQEIKDAIREGLD